MNESKQADIKKRLSRLKNIRKSLKKKRKKILKDNPSNINQTSSLNLKIRYIKDEIYFLGVQSLMIGDFRVVLKRYKRDGKKHFSILYIFKNQEICYKSDVEYTSIKAIRRKAKKVIQEKPELFI